MKIVCVANCPNGMAHTYMAAESIEKAAKELGVDIKVETQGAIGTENALTTEEIAAADCVLLATGIKIDMKRFVGKRLIDWPVANIVQEAKQAVEAAINGEGSIYEDEDTIRQRQYEEKKKQRELEKAAKKKAKEEGDNMSEKKKGGIGILQNLMTGISYMVPVVACGGLLIAISFLWGLNPEEGTLGATLNGLGGTVIGFMIPVFTAGVAYSIGDKPAIVPGLAIGYLSANDVGASFIGGIIGGLLCGYIVKYLKKVNMPHAFQGIWAVIFMPLITIVVVGLLFLYVIGAPMASIMASLTGMLENMSTTSMVLLGVVMGLMTAFDMGGPCDKVAYGFSTMLLAEGINGPMAANMAAGMTAPIGLALATILFKNLFTDDEKEAGKVAWALGASFITEGAIPFAAADPLHVLPATMIGSAVTGALSVLFGCTLAAPHGGIFAIVIPGVVNKPVMYVLAIAIGACVTAVLCGLLKKIKANKAQ